MAADRGILASVLRMAFEHEPAVIPSGQGSILKVCTILADHLVYEGESASTPSCLTRIEVRRRRPSPRRIRRDSSSIAAA